MFLFVLDENFNFLGVVGGGIQGSTSISMSSGSSLVLYRVANCRFRVGSGYDNLGSGSGTGITLHLEPGYRVPSGNSRV